MEYLKTLMICIISLSSLGSPFTSFKRIETEDHLDKNLLNSIGIDIVIMKGKWTSKNVIDRFKKAKKIYASQCEVDIYMKSLTELEWKYPSKGLYYDLNDFFADRYHDGTQQFLYDLNFKARPLVIFLDSFDEYMPKLATAFPKVSLHTDSIALNTAWITNKVNNSDYKKEEPKDYSVLAHELGHLLLNDSHVFGDEPNLMHHKLTLLNGRLTKSQCQTIKRNLLNFN